MADVEISYKGSQIATMSATGVKTLLTGDTFCEDDIVVAYNKPSSTLQSKTVSPTTSQQTVSPDSGYDGLSSVTVNAMPEGTAGTPTLFTTTLSTNYNELPPMVDGLYSGNGISVEVVDGRATFSGTATTTGVAFSIPLLESCYVYYGQYLYLFNSVANASFAPSFELSTDISNTSIAPTLNPVNRKYEIPQNRDGVEIDRVRFYISSGITISGTFSPMLSWSDTETYYRQYGDVYSYSIQPRVTNTTGYITGGQKSGTSMTVKATDLIHSSDKSTTIQSAGTKHYNVSNCSGIDVTVPSGSAKVPNKSYSPSISISVDDETGEIQAYGSGSYTLAPTVTAGYVSSGTSGTISVSVWDSYQLPVYDGEHHQPPILTISLTNPSNPNYFDSCEIYDETSGETKIGEITSADGSVSLDLTDRFDWWDVDTLNLGIVFGCKSGGFIHFPSDGISCTGDVSLDYSSSDSAFFTVTGAGTIVFSGVNYNF
jgi:hypothetical protein